MSQGEDPSNMGQHLTTSSHQDQGNMSLSEPSTTTSTNSATTVANTPVTTAPGTNVEINEILNNNNKTSNEPCDESVVVLDNSDDSSEEEDDDLAIIETRQHSTTTTTRHSIVDLDHEPEIISVNNNPININREDDDDLAIIEERQVLNSEIQSNSGLQTIPLRLPGGNSIQINVSDYDRPIISSFVNNESHRDSSEGGRRRRRERNTSSSRLSRERDILNGSAPYTLRPRGETTFSVPERHNEDSGSTLPAAVRRSVFADSSTRIPQEMQEFIINSFTNNMERRRRQAYDQHLERRRHRRLRRRLNPAPDNDYIPPEESNSDEEGDIIPWEEYEEMYDEPPEDLFYSEPRIIRQQPYYDEARRTQNIISFIEQRENRERDIKVQKLKEKSEPLKQKYMNSAEALEKGGQYTSKFHSFDEDENSKKDTVAVPACTLCGVELGVGIPEDYNGIAEEDKKTEFKDLVMKYGFHCPYQSLFNPTQLDKDLSKRTFISKGCGHLFCGRCFARIDNAKGKTKLSKKKLAELKGSSNPNNYGPRVCPAKDCKNINRAKNRLKEVYF